LKVTGTLKAQHFYAEAAKFRGEADIRGNLSAGSFDILGNLTVRGDCEAESLDVKGAFTIDGLLNADTIQVRLYGLSRAKEIGGEKIEIRRRSRLSRLLIPFVFSGSDSVLTAETIEGDDIYLEYTKAGCVRGNDVTIGPGCEIGTVEFKRHLLIDEDANVMHHQKL
jgi:cytoskeletal protein CcmA (bactofilin family)